MRSRFEAEQGRVQAQLQSEDPVTGVKMLIAPDGQQPSYGISDDVAGLFGNMYGNNSDGDTVGYADFGLNLNTLLSKIFDPVEWYGKDKPDWSYSSGNVDISYFKLDAKSVENEAFGVKGGQAVNLGIFIANNSNSGPSPITSAYLDSCDANSDVSDRLSAILFMEDIHILKTRSAFLLNCLFVCLQGLILQNLLIFANLLGGMLRLLAS